MAQPVWTLSVDLQTKTATFTTGMADAAKAARGSFNDIKDGAREMGAETGYSMTEARHSVMLLGEEFGVHLPRGITSFLASLGPVGAAMEAAFPFLAIIAGVTLLLEHLEKLHKAAEENAAGWSKIGDDSEASLQKTDREIKQVVNATEELTGGPLLALTHRLQNIDQQQFDNLLGNFKKVGDEIDKMLGGEQRGNIMTMLFGQNVEGELKEGFDKFRNAYSSFLQTGDTKLAAQELEREIGAVGRKLEDLQIAAQNTTAPGLKSDLENVHALYNELVNVAAFQDKQQDLAAKQKNYQSQSAELQNPEAFHPELFAEAENKKRVSIAETIEAIRKEREEANKSDELQLLGVESLAKGLKELADERAKLAQEAGKEDAGHGMKMAELQLEANKEAGKMQQAQRAMTNQEILDMDLDFNKREHDAQQRALNDELAALDAHDKAYENKKKALNDKLLELDKQFQNKQEQLVDQSQMKEMTTLTTWLTKQQSLYTGEFSKVLMGKETFGKMMQNVDSQIASQALSSALTSAMQLETVQGRKHFNDARTAAADAWASAGNPIVGALSAAATFAAVMGLEAGGIVPGVGMGDTVPAMLTPGEAVLPKKLTEGLTNMAKFGGASSQSGDVHVHHHATYNVQAFDSAGVDKVLRDHGDKFVKHAANHLRKMNK